MRSKATYLTFAWLISLVCLKPVAAEKTAGSVFTENRMSVVHVQVQPDPASPTRQPSYGTGFIVGSDGFVLTAKHNLTGFISSEATPISVRIGSLDGPQVPAEYFPLDIGIDVAMLKLRSPIGIGLTAYRTVIRGDSTDSEKARNGSDVFIVGFNLTSNTASISD